MSPTFRQVGLDVAGWQASEDLPRKKRDILRTAKHLFYRHGMRRISVEEICREAGTSKGTFYKYFPNKIELVKYILIAMSEAAHRRTAAIEALDLPFEDKVRRLIDERLESTRKTSEAFIEDFYHADEELAAFVDQLAVDNQRRFLDIVTAAQERGDMRPEVKPEFVLALLAKLNELAGDDDLRAHYPDYVGLTREIVDFFFKGLLSPRAGADQPQRAQGPEDN